MADENTQKIFVSIADFLYPVGTYYYCDKDTPNVNSPSSLFGGTWATVGTMASMPNSAYYYGTEEEARTEGQVTSSENCLCYLRTGW